MVIGAGVSGLAAAYELAKSGCPVSLLEQSPRVGGCVHTERTPEGYLIEHGPNSLLNLNPDVDRLCQELGIDHERVFQDPVSRRRYLVKAGALVPVPARFHQAPFTPLWSATAKLRALTEPLIPGRASTDDETVAAFVARRFGPEFVDYGVEPFVAGIFAGDPDQLSMAASFPRIAALEREYGSVVTGLIRTRLNRRGPRTPLRVFSFRKGVGHLPEAFHRYLGDRVRTGTRVTEISRRFRDGAPSFSIRVTGPQGEQVLAADRLVIATPADVAARLLNPMSPPLADQLEQIPYAPVGLIHVGVSRSHLTRLPEGSGCLIPRREGLSILGSLWSSNIYPDRAPHGRVLLTNYVGGVRDSDVLKWSDDELVKMVVTALRGLLGLCGEPEFVRVVRHARAIPQYVLGHQQRIARINTLLRPVPGVFLTGNYLYGVSVRDCLTQGIAVARRVIESHSGTDQSLQSVDVADLTPSVSEHVP